MPDNSRLESIRDTVLKSVHGQMGIGTLKEKTVHMVLKKYYEDDIDYHEVAIDKYVADICRDNKIIEIQTGNFNKMRDKLEVFLKDYSVTIVYPIPCVKWLNWIDKDSLEVKSRRKSPKKGTPYQAFYELYKIKNYLKNSNLHLKIVMLDVEEYRLLNGWSEDKKRGSVRYDRIPLRIEQEIDIDEINDYMQLIPYNLPENFLVKDYAKAAKLTPRKASTALNILSYLNIVEKIGKKGNAFVYQVVERGSSEDW